MRCWPAVGLVVLLSACTFPDVDYADGGVSASGGSAGSGPCPASPSCANDAKSCADLADKKDNACTHQCKPTMPDCVAQCDAELATALGVCSASCVSCAGAACGGAPTNCDALVGL